MANINTGNIEKTVWTYKNMKESQGKNDNTEIILNFLDRTKFELNYNKYHGSL